MCFQWPASCWRLLLIWCTVGVGTVDIRLPWPYDPAIKPVPDGWSRDTAFDGRFLQGSDVTFAGSSDAGGAHDHEDTTDGGAGHTHPGVPHAHEFWAGSNTFLGTAVQEILMGANIASDAEHGHAAVDSASATITYSTEVITIQGEDARPPWLGSLILKPDDIAQTIPADAMCFSDGTLPDRYAVADSEWADRFVVGAPAEGVGGQIGGSATHTHTADAHDHLPDPHTHGPTLCGGATSTTGVLLTGATKSGAGSKHHNVTLDAPSPALDDVSDETVTVQAASSEPAYVKLLAIVKAVAGGRRPAAGVILPYVGRADALPSEWVPCDGTGGTIDCTDRQVRITCDAGEVGETGGGNAHTHTIVSHGHAEGSHDHPVSDDLDKLQIASGTTSVLYTRFTHSHGWSVEDVTPTMGDATPAVTISSEDGRAAYRTVLWVKYVPAPPAPPIVRATREEPWIPGWADQFHPDDYVPDERGPWETPPRGWSIRRCGSVLWGWWIVPEGYCQQCGWPIRGVINCPECGTPFDRSSGVDPDAGKMRPITAHPVRAISLLGEPGMHNQEVCRHHLGRLAIDRKGRMCIRFNFQPDLAGPVYDGVGWFQVCRDEHSEYFDEGTFGGASAIQLPSTTVGFFDAYRPACGDPI